MSDELKDLACAQREHLREQLEKDLLEDAKQLLETQRALHLAQQPSCSGHEEGNTAPSSAQELDAEDGADHDTDHGAGANHSADIGTVDDSVCEEVAANFHALLNDVDFTPELRSFNIGTFNRTLRKSLLEELRMVYIGLWAFALEQSFPQTASSFFTYFVHKYVQSLPESAQKSTHDKIMAYRDMILRSDAKDFNHISQHLLSFTKVKEENMKADTLRLSLALRNHYTFIFQRLV